MSRKILGVSACAAVMLAAPGSAVADLVLLGGAPTGSFVQFWTYSGQGPATIDTAVIQFISRTTEFGAPSWVTGWIGVDFHGPWSTPFQTDTIAVGTGPLGTAAFFDIHHDDPQEDVVTFRFWGYRSGQAVYGEQIVTSVNPFLTTPESTSLDPSLAPTLIPIPQGAAIGFAGLAGLATVMVFRRRALRA